MNVKPLSILTALAALAIPVHASAGSANDSKDWSYSIGIGFASLPAYLGADKNRTAITPDIKVTYKNIFFASTSEGIGFNVVNGPTWQAGPVVKLHPGRAEDGDSSFFIGGDNTTDLMGLGDIDGGPEIGGFIQYSTERLSTSFELRQGMDGHDGAVGEASVQWRGMLNMTDSPLFYTFGPEVVFGDSNYVSAFFDVGQQQSAASGLAVHDADGGIVSYGLKGALVRPINQTWSLIGYGNVSQLSDEIADSSLVAVRGSDRQHTIGVMLKMSY